MLLRSKISFMITVHLKFRHKDLVSLEAIQITWVIPCISNKNKTSKKTQLVVLNLLNIEQTLPRNHLVLKSPHWIETLQDILELVFLLSNISLKFRMRPLAKITSHIVEWRLLLLKEFNNNRCNNCTNRPKRNRLDHCLKDNFQTSTRLTSPDQTRIE